MRISRNTWGAASLASSIIGSALLLGTSVAKADPATPSGPHPRLFMSADNLAVYQSNATKSGTAAAALVAACQDTIANPGDYTTRGGSDGKLLARFSLRVRIRLPGHRAEPVPDPGNTKYWQASLSDDQTIGDGLGCVPGVSTNWQAWAQGGSSGAAPPVILTITHDTGYPIRWYAPDIAVTYDWLYNAPGVTAALQSQTQVCLTNWLDYYTAYGYHATEAGSNYNAGYVAGKALGAVAIGTDGAADGHLWTQVIDNDVTNLLIGTGLASGSSAAGPGVMVGGDWGEGWEYGPLSVLEYAAATSALELAGASLPAMDAWASSLFLRHAYARTAAEQVEFCGNGDCDITTPNKTPDVNELDAVLLGSPTSQAASWALSLKQSSNLQAGSFFYNAVAEARSVTPQDYTQQTPAPPLWYVTPGTREIYASAGNDPAAYWGVFKSSPEVNSDHQHFDASSFVFSRGADDLIVDPAPYGA